MRVALVMALVLAAGCSRGTASAPAREGNGSLTPPAVAAAPQPAKVPTDVAAGDAFVIRPGKAFANLAVYPITSKRQVDPGNVITLEEALQKGTAEVREVGSDPTAAVPSQAHGDRRLARSSSGATVGKLVIENKGDSSVFVIAGTVVKGGNQDRQIGQDFVIEGHQTVPVDAFCVEHGRWQGDRNGQATGGRFGSTQLVATSKVRAAAQYKHDQSEVWQQVAQANAANKKEAATGTFMATLDDAEIVKQRTALAGQIDSFLKSVKPENEVIGVAYAVDGQVRGARFFAHTRLFKMFESKLVQSIALEGITSKAEASQAGRPAFTGPPPQPAAVDGWMKEVESQAVREERDTAAANTNEYKESARAYGSKAVMKPKAAASPNPAAPPAKPTTLSVDYLAK
jgi:hypothetical protein